MRLISRALVYGPTIFWSAVGSRVDYGIQEIGSDNKTSGTVHGSLSRSLGSGFAAACVRVPEWVIGRREKLVRSIVQHPVNRATLSGVSGRRLFLS